MIKILFNDHRETIMNVFWRGLQLAVKDGVNFIIFILAAKFLSPYEFGVYNYVLAVIFFLILFGDFGISMATSKYVAEYQVTDQEKLKYILFNAGLVIFILTLLVAASTLLLGASIFQENYLYVLYILPVIFLAPITSLYDGIYRGIKQFQKLALLSTGVTVFSLGFIFFLIRKYGLTGALLSQNLFYLLLFLVLACCYRDFVFKFNWQIIKTLGVYSLVIGIMHVSAFLYMRVDILVLGYFNMIVEIGYYEIAMKVLMLIQLPFLVYAQVQAPNMVAVYCREGSPAILRKLTLYIKYATVITILTSILLAITAPWMIRHFLPEYYLPGVIRILYIFLFLFIFQNVSNLVGNAFIISTGHAKINMINIIVFGILSLVLDVLFVYYLGYMGIAYAKLIVMVTGSLSLILLYMLVLKKRIHRGALLPP